MKRRIRRTKQSDDLKALAEKRAKIQAIKKEAREMESSMLADMFVYACERKVYHNDDTFPLTTRHIVSAPPPSLPPARECRGGPGIDRLSSPAQQLRREISTQ